MNLELRTLALLIANASKSVTLELRSLALLRAKTIGSADLELRTLVLLNANRSATEDPIRRPQSKSCQANHPVVCEVVCLLKAIRARTAQRIPAWTAACSPYDAQRQLQT
jgi:hypothetical protein